MDPCVSSSSGWLLAPFNHRADDIRVQDFHREPFLGVQDPINQQKGSARPKVLV